MRHRDAILARVEARQDELVELTRELIRIPTINPPGQHYAECAALLADRLNAVGFEVELLRAEGEPEHSRQHPRVNVLGRLAGREPRPCLHLNGHLDVVPPGHGWKVDPFGGLVREGRIYGRGSADMKAGLAAALFACEAVLHCGVPLQGQLEFSATVDEESGGQAGVAWLARHGWLDSSRVDFVIIPEPLDVDRICIGHRGAYWFKVIVQGRIGHGSMPLGGINAIEIMGRLLEDFRNQLGPRFLTRKTSLPVVPTEARHPSLNCNAIHGGQAGERIQTPCIPDRCEAVLDRRFLPEENLDQVRAEIQERLRAVELENGDCTLQLEDLMIAQPVQTHSGSQVVRTLQESVRQVLGRAAKLVASPGTYDHKHVTQIGGIQQCVAYGPGRLDLAHQPDEYCAIEDLVDATKVLALSIVDLIGDGET